MYTMYLLLVIPVRRWLCPLTNPLIPLIQQRTFSNISHRFLPITGRLLYQVASPLGSSIGIKCCRVPDQDNPPFSHIKNWENEWIILWLLMLMLNSVQLNTNRKRCFLQPCKQDDFVRRKSIKVKNIFWVQLLMFEYSISLQMPKTFSKDQVLIVDIIRLIQNRIYSELYLYAGIEIPT